jgi:hypothetical protein
LEEQYKRELFTTFGIVFNRLYTFANMPIGRFREFLIRSNNMKKYEEEIQSAFNAATLEGIMCRHLISVGWDGKLYDRDFNNDLLAKRKIVTDNHCFACTAGQGST